MPKQQLIWSVWIAGAALLLPAIAQPAGDANTPYAKPGLWILTQQLGSGQAPRESRICIDAASQQALLGAGNATMKSLCSKNLAQTSGSTVTRDSICKLGESTVTSHSVLTFAGDSAFHNVTDGKMSPPMMGMSESHAIQDGKWSGACPAGMVPGDMVGPGGMKLHLGPNGPEPMRH